MNTQKNQRIDHKFFHLLAYTAINIEQKAKNRVFSSSIARSSLLKKRSKFKPNHRRKKKKLFISGDRQTLKRRRSFIFPLMLLPIGFSFPVTPRWPVKEIYLGLFLDYEEQRQHRKQQRLQ